MVEEYSNQSSVKHQVLSIPVQVAALISPKYLVNILAEINLKNFKSILIPGMIKGDISEVSKTLGIPLFKGPKHAADIPVVLNNFASLKLSTEKPACELIQCQIKKKILKDLITLRRKAFLLKRKGLGFNVGVAKRKVWTDFDFPPLITAEIVNVNFLSDRAVLKKAEYYVNSGADIIDIGMSPGGSHPEEAARVVKLVSIHVRKPVSIDSNDPDEIDAAVKSGASLILSINGENMREVSRKNSVKETLTVVTPADEEGMIPQDPLERTIQLEENINRAKTLGFKSLIADPLLTIYPSLVNSLQAYIEFRKRNPRIPILFGAGNITELADVDSIGINFILSSLAYELGKCIIFTTEASDKTFGSVKEISIALKMIAVARNRKSPPKDLGLDLLFIKEKRKRDDILEFEMERVAKILRESSDKAYKVDPKGFFKFRINRRDNEIFALHFRHGENTPHIAIKGTDPVKIYRKIIGEGLISTLDHAAYVGSELQKIKIALQTGRGYIQDDDIFQHQKY